MRYFKLQTIVVFIGFFTLANAQQNLKNLEEALSYTYALQGNSGPQSINWLPDAKGFSFINEENQILVFDATKKSDSLLFDPKTEKFSDGKEFSFDSFEWSRDHKFIVFKSNSKQVWRNSAISDYYLYSIEKKTLKIVVKEARTAQISPDGKKLAYEKNGDMFVIELANNVTKRLTNSGSSRIQNGRFGWVYEEEFGLVQAWTWSPDSKNIAFWETNETKVPIYKLSALQESHPKYNEIPYPRVGDQNVSVRIGVVSVLKPLDIKWAKIDLNDGYIPRIYWTSQNNKLAIQYLNRSQNHLILYSFDVLKNITKVIFEESDNKGWVDIFDFFANSNDFMKFDPDQPYFYWLSGRSGFQHIYKYDLDGKLVTEITQGIFDVVSIEALSKDAIYFISTEVSPLEKKLFKISKNGGNSSLITEAKGNHKIQISENGDLILDSYSNIDTPYQVRLLNQNGIKIKEFENNQEVLKFTSTLGYSKKELSSFLNSKNIIIDYSILKPQNFDENKVYPVLLSIYGGPGSQSVYNQWGTGGWEQWLSQNGYVVVSVNNRGSGGYGQDFMQSVYKNLGDNESQDFVETIDFLKNKYKWISKDKIAIQGHSYGGFMSAYSVLKHPEVFKAAIVGAPVTNWKLYDNIYTERYMGLLNTNENQYDKNNLSLMASNLKSKVLLAHSLMDDNVHVLNTMQLVKALTDAQKDIDLRIYPEGNHGVAYNYQSYVLLHKTYFEFLEKHLK